MGGLCQFDGEDEEALENDPRRFNAQPVWKRFIVILVGPFMNILTAFLIAFVFYLCKPMPVYAVDPVTHYEVPIVASVKENSPAEKAGLKTVTSSLQSTVNIRPKRLTRTFTPLFPHLSVPQAMILL